METEGTVDNSIEIEELYKAYGDVKAVNGISFSVERGTLFAFLGINGAGKSTTINILCSILPKDSGSVRINGFDLDTQADKIKPDIGIVFQSSVLDAKLTVKDNLAVRASFYGLKGAAFRARLAELTELLELEPILNRPFGKLSGGQKRRADIARGLINRPKLLVLDEPTTGLDPQTRKKVWSVIGDLRAKEGMTVFLTTHYMEESAGADRVVILDEGRIAADGTPTTLKNAYSHDYVKLYGDVQTIGDRLTARGYGFSVGSGCCAVTVDDSAAAYKFLTENVDLANDFEVIKGNMDDVFLQVTGKKLEVTA